VTWVLVGYSLAFDHDVVLPRSGSCHVDLTPQSV